jgi:hypothetical protein
MATKYDRVNPYEEKLKRLFNCNRMILDDQKYLNYTFDRYKLRSVHIGCFSFSAMFLMLLIPVIKNATPFKRYTAVIFTGVTIY